MTLLRSALLALLVFSIAACDSTGPDGPAASVLYVGNAGNFSDNNGSLTRYDLATETATQDAVPNLGGLVQNLYGEGNTLSVLLNFDDSFSTGRGRIDLVDAVTGQRTRQIDVRTPRAQAGFVFTGSGPAEVYVSNLYDNTVTPITLASGEAGTPISVGSAPEGVVSAGGRVYVANSGFGAGTSLSVLADGRVVDTLDGVCTGPRTLLRDADGEVWVICTGARDFTTGAVTAPGEVVVLDAATGAVRQRTAFPGETLGSATFGQDGTVTASLDRPEIYVITETGVARFDTRTNTRTARIVVSGAPIGAVAYDVAEDRLYLGRPDAASPYTVDGVVTIHDREGTEVGRFGAGIAPASMAFVSATRLVQE